MSPLLGVPNAENEAEDNVSEISAMSSQRSQEAEESPHGLFHEQEHEGEAFLSSRCDEDALRARIELSPPGHYQRIFLLQKLTHSCHFLTCTQWL